MSQKVSARRASSRLGDEPERAEKDSALDRQYRRLAERVAGLPGGALTLKAVVFVLGLLFVVGGIALAVLPGPLTIPPILVGVYLWSLEFAWARRLRGRVNRSAREAWNNAKQHPVRAGTITLLGLVGAAVAIWAVGHYDLVARLKDFFTG